MRVLRPGMQDSKLKMEYGHDLNNLFAEAKRRGFTVCLEDMTDVIKFLAADHGKYGYLYVQDGGRLNYFNELTPVIHALQQVHNSMQDDLREVGRHHAACFTSTAPGLETNLCRRGECCRRSGW